uniref:Uncharacterized protein n=1 Tax=Mycena chlorophos TaxID=658473 RepID=A0ABQ0MCX2_MYCCL|nr:predicted protein [Mycena chlorophos]
MFPLPGRRPDSPPPRSPSPEPVLASLPPPRRPTRLSLQSNASSSSESSSSSKPHTRKLSSMRSCGDLRQQQPSPSRGRATRSIVSAPPTPRSPATPLTPSSRSRRTLSLASRAATRTRSRSPPPPPSPTLSSPVPPVPRIPDFVLAPTDKKPILHPSPPTPTVYLPEWEHHPLAPRTRKESRSPSRSAPRIMSARRAVAAPAPMMACSSALLTPQGHGLPTPQHVAAL